MQQTTATFKSINAFTSDVNQNDDIVISEQSTETVVTVEAAEDKIEETKTDEVETGEAKTEEVVTEKSEEVEENDKAQGNEDSEQ
ncbi:hypothetical protein LPJ73_003030 [Coemansia sp. RSA 2703]|nr:hypothetical protein LPJ73_003030 [Coemansia sp. RSA 2703]KAJ2376985.1 hypothetical protein IW150_001654 [Coemansia sp. RSA 2607]KAJ2396768.1 hypothetical protein GGI05_000973 [Coemansia sp. RSA 2603]